MKRKNLHIITTPITTTNTAAAIPTSTGNHSRHRGTARTHQRQHQRVPSISPRTPLLKQKRRPASAADRVRDNGGNKSIPAYDCELDNSQVPPLLQLRKQSRDLKAKLKQLEQSGTSQYAKINETAETLKRVDYLIEQFEKSGYATTPRLSPMQKNFLACPYIAGTAQLSSSSASTATNNSSNSSEKKSPEKLSCREDKAVQTPSSCEPETLLLRPEERKKKFTKKYLAWCSSLEKVCMSLHDHNAITRAAPENPAQHTATVPAPVDTARTPIPTTVHFDMSPLSAYRGERSAHSEDSSGSFSYEDIIGALQTKVAQLENLLSLSRIENELLKASLNLKDLRLDDEYDDEDDIDEAHDADAEDETNEVRSAATPSSARTVTPLTPNSLGARQQRRMQQRKASLSLVQAHIEIDQKIKSFNEKLKEFDREISFVNYISEFYKQQQREQLLMKPQVVQPPTGRVALVFTDVEQSTKLWELDLHVMAEAMKIHNQVIRECLQAFNGYEVKTKGDAFMCAFSSSWDAVQFAMACQVKLVEAPWPEELVHLVHDLLGGVEGKHGFPGCELQQQEKEEQEGATTCDENQQLPQWRGLRVRMGIHVGEPIVEIDRVTQRYDYFGPPVNRAARIEGLAHGGQIIISNSIWRDIKKRITTSPTSSRSTVTWDLGEFMLKGMERPEHVHAILPRRLQYRRWPRPTQQSPSSPVSAQGPVKQLATRRPILRQAAFVPTSRRISSDLGLANTTNDTTPTNNLYSKTSSDDDDENVVSSPTTPVPAPPAPTPQQEEEEEDEDEDDNAYQERLRVLASQRQELEKKLQAICLIQQQQQQQHEQEEESNNNNNNNRSAASTPMSPPPSLERGNTAVVITTTAAAISTTTATATTAAAAAAALPDCCGAPTTNYYDYFHCNNNFRVQKMLVDWETSPSLVAFEKTLLRRPPPPPPHPLDIASPKKSYYCNSAPSSASNARWRARQADKHHHFNNNHARKRMLHAREV